MQAELLDDGQRVVGAADLACLAANACFKTAGTGFSVSQHWRAERREHHLVDRL
eukprot:COSAG01_NODE_66716_length_269_cov_0.611765_1_plen_53_part_01